jgi:dienelactone hydrolase
MSAILQELNTQTFTVSGSQGVPMAGDVTYPQNKKYIPVVLYAHGINGFKDWGGTQLIAEAFAKLGFAFIKFNFSHNGTTPAHPDKIYDLLAYQKDTYLKRQFDLQCMLDFIQANVFEWPFQPQAVGLIGHSRGGTDALLFAKTTGINKLITWSAPAEAKTPWGKWTNDQFKQWEKDGVMHLENKRTNQQLPIEYGLYEEYKKYKNEALDTEQAARLLNKPWLIVHGEEDEAVFVKDAYLLKEWQPQAKVAILKGAGHTYARKHPWPETKLPEASENLVAVSVQFLKE